MDNFQHPQFQQQYMPPQYPEPGRSTTILILGILSLVCFGPFTGIPAWVMGHTDLKKIDQRIIAPTERGSTKAGMVMGIIGTFISIGAIWVMGIAVVVGINLFNASAVDANRNAVIADLNNISAMAQQYYKKPVSLGGGGNSFIGFTIPTGLAMNANGEYSVEAHDQEIIITGKGRENGDDGGKLIQTATVSSTGITMSKQN